MIEENKREQSSEIQSSTLFADSLKAEISLLETKIEKLMNLYLESALSIEEYRDAKNTLMSSKQLLKEKLSAFEQKANNRFELTEKFLKLNAELANDQTNEEKLHLFKKVGSNFEIKERTVFFEPRGAWKTLLDSTLCGGSPFVSHRRCDTVSVLSTHTDFLRKRGDSNSRRAFALATFRKWDLQPLGHAS